ncbi:MAG: Uma2 family endonuclease [Cyanobacteria bacterium J06554_11]
MTSAEYLEWESHQEIRYEYSNGEVFAMAGGTKDHDKIAFNLRKVLDDKVETEGCDMTGSEIEVMVQDGRFYRYPDLTVGCDKRDRENETFYQFPKLIVEVISDSTENVDRGDKFQEYIQIPTLKEYVLVSSRQIQVECYRRGEGK